MPSFLQRRRLGAILFVFIVLGASMALAQDNPQSGETPWQDDTSNWCDAGNVWGDGRCNTDDEALTNWLYNAGWWFQRVTEGDITPCEVPEDSGRRCELHHRSEHHHQHARRSHRHYLLLDGDRQRDWHDL
jgi:hypothetical protein